MRDADSRVRDADSRVRDADSRVRDADSRVRDADSRVRDTDSRVRDADDTRHTMMRHYSSPGEGVCICIAIEPAGVAPVKLGVTPPTFGVIDGVIEGVEDPKV